MRTKILLTIALVISSLAPLLAQSPDKAKLDRFFDRLVEKNKAMGSLVITKDGKPVYDRSIGFSRIAGREKTTITAATRFRIGSISKMFTAVMVLQLADEKKLKLSDTMDKWFPRIPNARNITVAQLLAHRSGIHSMAEMPEYRALREKGATTAEMVALLEKAGPSDFEPGSKFVYTNENYVLIGLIIEKITGKSYQQDLEKRVTSKIGLKDTYVAREAANPTKNEAFSFRMSRDWEQETEIHWSLFFGSGNIYSTPHDLVKFISVLFDGKLVSKQSLELMKTMKDEYGLGMDVTQFGGKSFYGHTGGIQSSGAWLAYNPEEKLALAYTTNAKRYQVRDIVAGSLDIYWNRPFEIPAFDTVEVAPEILDRYVGTYAIPGTPAKVTFLREGSNLLFQFPNQSPARLEATDENKFKIDPPGVFFEFDAAKGEVKWRRGSVERVFVKEK